MLEIKNDASLFEGFELEEPLVEEAKKDSKDIVNFEIGSGSTLGAEIEKNLAGIEEEKKEDKEKVEEVEAKEETKVEETEEKDEADDVETVDPAYSFKAIGEYLKAEGVIDVDGFDELEDSPEVLSYIVEKSVSKGVDRYKESLPPLVSQLVDYLENGGDETKFLETLQKPLDLKSIDLEVESNQELVVREYLKSLEYDVEDIDELIETYKDSLVLEKQSNIAMKKLNVSDSKRTEQLVKEQAEEAKENQKKVDEYIEKVKGTVNNTKQLAGLNIEDTEKNTFIDYMLKRSPKSGLTKYQEELNEDYVKNSVELAYLKFKKYDFSKIEKKAQSQAAKDLKNKVFGKTEGAPKGKTQSAAEGVDFSAFRSMFGK